MATEALPLVEAARRLGIAERTLRARIKEGKVRADKVIGPKGGAVYRVYLDDPGHDPDPDPSGRNGHADPALDPDPGLAELAAVIREQAQRLEYYAGQIGYYQRRVQELEEQVRQLTAPAAEPANEPVPTDQANEPTTQDTTPAPSGHHSASERPMRPWWKRLVGWASQPV